MIVVIKKEYEEKQLKELLSKLNAFGVKTEVVNCENKNFLIVSGDTEKIDAEGLKAFSIVESVKRINEPFVLSNRKFHSADTVVDVSGKKFGGEYFQIIAGPCAVESEEQLMKTAQAVKKAGATLLRAGAFKPRTSPYTFQGLGKEGIEILLNAKKETGLPVVSEITGVEYLPLFENIDVIQIGARNMQNFELIKEVGKLKKTVLLKRGFASTIEELLLSAEYLMKEGTTNVILCERGIRTFEEYTRNTLDISAVPLLKELSHLPVIVDPSHATGMAKLVKPLSLASVAVGADGLMIEVHPEPEKAFSDGAQAVTPTEFKEITEKVTASMSLYNKKY